MLDVSLNYTSGSLMEGCIIKISGGGFSSIRKKKCKDYKQWPEFQGGKSS